jgi:hypothetical protein
LSFNKIRKIEGLAELLSLQYLDLRANSITSINDLEELKLVGVSILPVEGYSVLMFFILALLQLPTLQTLHLQSSDGEDGNPGTLQIAIVAKRSSRSQYAVVFAACKHPSYITIVMRCLPQLQILDGTTLYIQRLESRRNMLYAVAQEAT